MNSHRPLPTKLHWLALLILAAISISSAAADPLPRERLLMDFGWKFHLGDDWGLCERLDKAGMSTGPAGCRFQRRQLARGQPAARLGPELPFDRKADGEPRIQARRPRISHNSVGWYRRTFDLPESDNGRRLMLEFDGVYRDCRVFFNGYLIGHHESGYSSFRYDITDVANCGGEQHAGGPRGCLGI